MEVEQETQAGLFDSPRHAQRRVEATEPHPGGIALFVLRGVEDPQSDVVEAVIGEQLDSIDFLSSLEELPAPSGEPSGSVLDLRQEGDIRPDHPIDRLRRGR